jgi:hypothetical protein
VLLLEADVYRPSLGKKLGLDPWPGLTDCYRDKRDPSASIRRIEPLGFYFLPAGRPFENAESLLPSDWVAQLLEHLSPEFDWILIDSPPALPVAEVLALKEQTDAALLVVRAGRTQRKAVEEAIRILGRDYLAGILLNGVEGLDQAYSQYYAYGYEAAQSKSHVWLRAIQEHAGAGWRFAREVAGGLEATGKRYAREAKPQWGGKKGQDSVPSLQPFAVPLGEPAPVVPAPKEDADPKIHQGEEIEEREDILARLRMRIPPPERKRIALPRLGDAFAHPVPWRPVLVLTGVLMMALLLSFVVSTALRTTPAATPPLSTQGLATPPSPQVPIKLRKVGTAIMQGNGKQNPVAASPSALMPGQAQNPDPISVQGGYTPCAVRLPLRALGGEEEASRPGTQPDRATCRDEIGKQDPHSEYSRVINLTFPQ